MGSVEHPQVINPGRGRRLGILVPGGTHRLGMSMTAHLNDQALPGRFTIPEHINPAGHIERVVNNLDFTANQIQSDLVSVPLQLDSAMDRDPTDR
jgi:hypothetical protein